jgi:hypothetical protein
MSRDRRPAHPSPEFWARTHCLLDAPAGRARWQEYRRYPSEGPTRYLAYLEELFYTECRVVLNDNRDAPLHFTPRELNQTLREVVRGRGNDIPFCQCNSLGCWLNLFEDWLWVRARNLLNPYIWALLYTNEEDYPRLISVAGLQSPRCCATRGG